SGVSALSGLGGGPDSAARVAADMPSREIAAIMLMAARLDGELGELLGSALLAHNLHMFWFLAGTWTAINIAVGRRKHMLQHAISPLVLLPIQSKPASSSSLIDRKSTRLN